MTIRASDISGFGSTAQAPWQVPALFDPGNLADGFDFGLKSGSLPQIGQKSGFLGDIGGLDAMKLALSGIGTIGNLWGASKQLGLAKKTFNFQKDFANTNLANQISSYNTSLADRARARYAFEGRSQEDAQSYIDENRLKERTVG